MKLSKQKNEEKLRQDKELILSSQKKITECKDAIEKLTLATQNKKKKICFWH